MKISDKGLQEILSLGLKKETSVAGVYFVYEWDDVKYLAVPNENSPTPQEYASAVRILLTPEQYKVLQQTMKKAPEPAQPTAPTPATTQPTAAQQETQTPQPAPPTQPATQASAEAQTKQGVLQPQSAPKVAHLDSEKFSDTTSYFENLILLSFDATQNIFTYKAGHGTNNTLQNFTCGIDKPSPLKILYDTKKPFHGKYHPIDNFDECLKLVNIKTASLWISAYPLVSGGRLVGAVIAFSNKSAVTTDVIENFKEAENIYIQALAANS